MVAGLSRPKEYWVVKKRFIFGGIFTLSLVAGFTAIEVQSASKRYVINGKTYDVPRANQFGGSGNFDVPGLDKESADSI